MSNNFDINVHGCYDCPFYVIFYEEPDENGCKFNPSDKQNIYEDLTEEEYDNGETPEWCPLRSENARVIGWMK